MTDSLAMYALLGLDAYNEDPNTAQLKVTLPNDQLGDDATKLDDDGLLPTDYQSTGFYAPRVPPHDYCHQWLCLVRNCSCRV
jgi:hypothetical protein